MGIRIDSCFRSTKKYNRENFDFYLKFQYCLLDYLIIVIAIKKLALRNESYIRGDRK